MKCRVALFISLALVWGVRAKAQDRGGSAYAPVSLPVACGDLSAASCLRVLPSIAARTSQAGIVLIAVQTSGGSICQTHAPAAIVQRDVAIALAGQPACQDRYDIVGRPLWPEYAFLVVSADSPIRRLSDFAAEDPARLPDSARRPKVIASGPEGQGSQVTLANLLRSDPASRQAITVTTDDLDTGLTRLADGSIDGVFLVTSLDSAAIGRIRTRVDARGRPLFGFAAIRPAEAFLTEGDGHGGCLYRLTALDLGGAGPVTTISTDAVMILAGNARDVHAKGGPHAAEALASAIEATRSVMLADTNSPRDWRAAGGSCH